VNPILVPGLAAEQPVSGNGAGPPNEAVSDESHVPR
jgi:hypothetical protein